MSTIKKYHERWNQMKKIILFIFCFLLAGNLVMCFTAGAEDTGKATEGNGELPASGTGHVQSGVEKRDYKKIVAARVNGVDITMQSLMMMTNRMIEKQGQVGADPEDFEKIKKAALDRLILQELALQDAKTRGVEVEQKQIDDTVANLKISKGGEEEYKKYLKKEGVTESEARAAVERTLALRMIFDKKVKELNDKIAIDENALREEYEQNESKFVRPEKTTVIDVILFISADDEDAEKISKEILRKIKNDKDHDPMNLVPDGTFIARELDLDKNKHEILYEEAKKLKEGELSGIITTPDSLHIIKLMKFSPEKRYSLDEVRPFLERKLRGAELLKRIQVWEDGLRKDAKIEVMDFEKSNMTN